MGRLSRTGVRAAEFEEGAWVAVEPSDLRRLMAEVGLGYLRLGQPATELSGGERSRALLARVLAGEAPVILADEPTTSLDPHYQIEVMRLLHAAAVPSQEAASACSGWTCKGRRRLGHRSERPRSRGSPRPCEKLGGWLRAPARTASSRAPTERVSLALGP